MNEIDYSGWTSETLKKWHDMLRHNLRLVEDELSRRLRAAYDRGEEKENK